MHTVLASNAFAASYIQSDWFGKLIFISLFALSIFSWILIAYKVWLYSQMKKMAKDFERQFSQKELFRFSFTPPKAGGGLIPNPYLEIYKELKGKTFQMIERNRYFAEEEQSFLSDQDLNLIEAQVVSTVSKQNKHMEKNLFILSTIATLGPFLGLLGTVWGILITFSELNVAATTVNNKAMLAGLSMALTTTILGLVIAIIAFIGYNYLKNKARDFLSEMQEFTQILMASVELQYRKPEYAKKTTLST